MEKAALPRSQLSAIPKKTVPEIITAPLWCTDWFMFNRKKIYSLEKGVVDHGWCGYQLILEDVLFLMGFFFNELKKLKCFNHSNWLHLTPTMQYQDNDSTSIYQGADIHGASENQIRVVSIQPWGQQKWGHFRGDDWFIRQVTQHHLPQSGWWWWLTWMFCCTWCKVY